MALKNPMEIEVFRLHLRGTVNEGGEDNEHVNDVTGEAEPLDPVIEDEDNPAGPDRNNFRQNRGQQPVKEREVVRNDNAESKLKMDRNDSATPLPREASRQVVLVTRPSQRDMEVWTERATSTMVKSASGAVRPRPTSVQSNRWVLEYKPVVRHSGWLIKRGHSIRNFKRRLFCIVDNELVYHDSHESADVRGRIDLRKKSTVQCLTQSGFKFTQGSYQIVLYATDKHDRDVWIQKLQEQNVELLPTSAKISKLIERQNSNEKGLVFSGWLCKRGQIMKSTKRRWFELTNTTLTYYAHPEGGSKKGSIEIVNARISTLDTLKTGERHSFLVRTSSRELVLHADSQEERALWIASLSSVAQGSGSANDITGSSTAPSASLEFGRMCVCSGNGESGSTPSDGYCRRCMSSFISKTEDAMLDVTREVQLILASPYSPEGSSSASFLKEHVGRQVSNAVVRQFMSGLADYMIHTRMNELLILSGNASTTPDGDTSDMLYTPETNEAIERITTIIYQQIEERVFIPPLYREILNNIRQQTRAESKLINGKMEVLRQKSQPFFGIGPDSFSSSSWVAACTKLNSMDKASLPYMKRTQLLIACKEIYSTYHQEHPTNPPMNADEFIPAFIYVLVHSKLANPVATKELLTFFDGGGTQGENAYFVTCVEIALEYIRSLLIACTVTLDASKKLGIEFAKDPERQVVIVNKLIPDEQAIQSGAINIGDVLVAINGLPVYEMELSELVKVVKGVEGDMELCFLPMNEYVRKFGMQRQRSRSYEDNDYTADTSTTSSYITTSTNEA